MLGGVKMVIQCPHCRTRYEIDDKAMTLKKYLVECPVCSTPLKGDRKPEKNEAVVCKGSVSVASPQTVRPDVAPAKTVLVVDDSRFFREMILDILEPLEADLTVATNGIEALQVIKNQKPNVVLLDLNLPGKNGFEIIREVRSNPALKEICLLAMSGVYYKEVDAAEAKKVGANDFIKKSFTPEELRRFVKMWLIW